MTKTNDPNEMRRPDTLTGGAPSVGRVTFSPPSGAPQGDLSQSGQLEALTRRVNALEARVTELETKLALVGTPAPNTPTDDAELAFMAERDDFIQRSRKRAGW